MELENNKGTWAQRSESISELAKALCQAQAEIEAVKKDASNPFFKSKYADLASIWHAIRGPLTKHGLSVLQEPSTEGAKVRITTTLMHSSGEYVRSLLEVTAAKVDPQGIGSAITYARRYALGPVVGIAPEDDDGNAASSGGGDKNVKPVPQNLGLKTADQAHQAATKAAFKGDDISWNSNGASDMSTTQVIKKQTSYSYDLSVYLKSSPPAKREAMIRKLEGKSGFEEAPGIWVVPEFLEGLAQFLVPEDSAERAA